MAPKKPYRHSTVSHLHLVFAGFIGHSQVDLFTACYWQQQFDVALCVRVSPIVVVVAVVVVVVIISLVKSLPFLKGLQLEGYSVQRRGQIYTSTGSGRHLEKTNDDDTVRSTFAHSRTTAASPVLENPLVFITSIKHYHPNRFLYSQNFGKIGPE